MFRDFHVIDSGEDSYLFFPETFKLYVISRDDGDAIRRYLDEGGSLRGELETILIEEEKKVLIGSTPLSMETDSLCLYMAHDCNISCTYCYNSGGRSLNPSMMMSEEVVEAAFRRFFTTPGKRYAVSFYGGEPLLNFKTIKRAVEVGMELERKRGVKIAYSITTNGTILTGEMAEFIKGCISNVCVSIDGSKETHDLHRKGEAGSSYEKALLNLAALRGGACRVTLRATVCGDTVGALAETVSHLSALPSDGYSVSPVNTGSSNQAYISDERFKEFVDRFVELTLKHFPDIIEGRGMGFKYTFNILFNLINKRRFMKHCDAGKNPAVAADGSLYACHGLVGIDEFYMGSVKDGLNERFGKVKETFAGLTVKGIEECSRCWARYLCGGSCYAHAYFNTGSLYRPDPRHCMLFKRNAEAVIGEFLRAMNDPDKRGNLYGNIKKALTGRDGGHEE